MRAVMAGRSAPAHGRVRRRGGGTSSQKGPDLLPPYTTGIVRIRSNLGHIEGARRGAGTRQEARADSASRSSAHFVDSQGVDPRSLNWKASSPGRSAGPKPRANRSAPAPERLAPRARPAISAASSTRAELSLPSRTRSPSSSSTDGRTASVLRNYLKRRPKISRLRSNDRN